MKAVLVTKDNQKYLNSRFNPSGDEDSMNDYVPIGFWLVMDFGPDTSYDILSGGLLERIYILGRKLNNGFIEVIKKGG